MGNQKEVLYDKDYQKLLNLTDPESQLTWLALFRMTVKWRKQN